MRVQIGPAVFDLRSPFADPIQAARTLYRDYPLGLDDEIYDFAVAAIPASPLRRFLRPSLVFEADHMVDDIVPLDASLALLGFEMAINLQMALGYRRDIVLHAASAERDGQGILITGESGAGKSTLSALLSYSAGWRHMGDELALLSLEDAPHLKPYPRPIGLKNRSIEEMAARAPATRFGPRLENTVKGTVQHLLPPVGAIAAMQRFAPPALIVAPHYREGAEPAYYPMSESACYLRLSTASTNQLKLGERGFAALVSVVRSVPAYDIVYGKSEDALALVDRLWTEHRR
ncbi:HPr kinase [Pacificimonas flava]|uniref:HPr kinase n=2 Tax=Pacificimonas flava TaxID=1234595 RepID=M2U8B8_9SPHN|nr:HprK-related kinase A [Pacificimonas flava]EMD84228.1 HPr kinase [Pacificimonas flava]